MAIPPRDAAGPVDAGRIGVYSIGALSMAFFARLRAERVIGRKVSATSDWAEAAGRVIVGGRPVDLRPLFCRGLAHAPTAEENRLPEVVIVSPNADQLDDFLEELVGYFSLLDRSQLWEPDAIPKFLLASSGLYFEEMLRRARAKVQGAPLERPGFFLYALTRRLFRAVAYQGGLRRARGTEAIYEPAGERAHLILSLNGTQEDRRRILETVRARGYDIRLEPRPFEGEYQKALANLLFSAFCQLYAWREDGLLKPRLGDFLPAGARLPPGFAPQELRDPPEFVRERMRRLGEAFVSVARARGAFAPDAAFEDVVAPIEEFIAGSIPEHLPSSVQTLYDRLLAPDSTFDPDELMPTEKWILEPLRLQAAAWSQKESLAEFEAFERDLKASYRTAQALRDDPGPPLARLARALPRLAPDEEILERAVRADLRDSYGRAFGLAAASARAWSARMETAFPAATRAMPEAPAREVWGRIIPLAAALLDRRRGPKALLVSLDGLPGSGKSTLAARLAAAARALGARAATVSIDDLYHGEERRRQLGLTGWGVGTHDLSLGERLAALKRAGPEDSVELPVFDKALRRRAPSSRTLQGPLDLVLFEGFATGLAGGGYEALSRWADYRIFLDAAPGSAREWRREAGWNDRAALYGGDRLAFERDFEAMWAQILEQSARVMPESRASADLVIEVLPGHALGRMTPR